MKILYDQQAFDMQQYGGVSNCFVQLISHLPEGIEYEISLKECDNVHLRDSGLMDIKPMSLSPRNFILKKHFLGQGVLYGWYSQLFPSMTSFGRNCLYSIEKLKKGDFDVFHPTFFDPYFLSYLKGKPYVLTVHDMIPELFFSKKDPQVVNKPLLCQKAAHVITVSERTKQDLIDILHVPENKVSVVYHGAPNLSSDQCSKPIVDGHYILFVGQRDRYKGFVLMLSYLLSFLRKHLEVNIVCTGPAFTKQELSYLKKNNIADRVMHVYANDFELQNLYSHALCFIYPSLYEGFGIPILEAYNANCPVLLNRTSCFPEIAQDAAIYFHLDYENSDLESVMENFIQMSSIERENLLKKQRKRLAFFSWEKSAQELAKIYELVV